MSPELHINHLIFHRNDFKIRKSHKSNIPSYITIRYIEAQFIKISLLIKLTLFHFSLSMRNIMISKTSVYKSFQQKWENVENCGKMLQFFPIFDENIVCDQSHRYL